MQEKITALRILIILICCVISASAFSQGCSDAGVCTAGSLRSDAIPMAIGKDSIPPKYTLIITPAIGMGEQSVINFTPTVDLTYQAAERLAFNLKIGFNLANGDLGTAYGASDLFLSGIVYFIKKEKMSLSFIGGAKFSVQKANFSIDDKVLPLSYQSGVGTNDLLLGLSFNYKTWYAGAGFQHSFSRSTNTFSHEIYDSTSVALNHFESNRLKRAPDFVLRAEKKFIIKKIRLGLGAGVVMIYHVANDELENSDGDDIEIIGSKGTTLNITAGVNYKINHSWSVNVGVGFPVLVRDVRPDGLTRSWVIFPSLTYTF